MSFTAEIQPGLHVAHSEGGKMCCTLATLNARNTGPVSQGMLRDSLIITDFFIFSSIFCVELKLNSRNMQCGCYGFNMQYICLMNCIPYGGHVNTTLGYSSLYSQHGVIRGQGGAAHRGLSTAPPSCGTGIQTGSWGTPASQSLRSRSRPPGRSSSAASGS